MADRNASPAQLAELRVDRAGLSHLTSSGAAAGAVPPSVSAGLITSWNVRDSSACGVYLSRCRTLGVEPHTAVAKRLARLDAGKGVRSDPETSTSASAAAALNGAAGGPGAVCDFSGIPVDAESFSCVLDALAAVPAVRLLRWRRCDLDDVRVERIAHAMGRIFGVQALDLGDNPRITKRGGETLLELMQFSSGSAGGVGGRRNPYTVASDAAHVVYVALDGTGIPDATRAQLEATMRELCLRNELTRALAERWRDAFARLVSPATAGAAAFIMGGEQAVYSPSLPLSGDSASAQMAAFPSAAASPSFMSPAAVFTQDLLGAGGSLAFIGAAAHRQHHRTASMGGVTPPLVSVVASPSTALPAAAKVTSDHAATPPTLTPSTPAATTPGSVGVNAAGGGAESALPPGLLQHLVDKYVREHATAAAGASKSVVSAERQSLSLETTAVLSDFYRDHLMRQLHELEGAGTEASPSRAGSEPQPITKAAGSHGSAALGKFETERQPSTSIEANEPLPQIHIPSLSAGRARGDGGASGPPRSAHTSQGGARLLTTESLQELQSTLRGSSVDLRGAVTLPQAVPGHDGALFAAPQAAEASPLPSGAQQPQRKRVRIVVAGESEGNGAQSNAAASSRMVGASSSSSKGPRSSASERGSSGIERGAARERASTTDHEPRATARQLESSSDEDDAASSGRSHDDRTRLADVARAMLQRTPSGLAAPGQLHTAGHNLAHTDYTTDAAPGDASVPAGPEPSTTSRLITPPAARRPGALRAHVQVITGLAAVVVVLQRALLWGLRLATWVDGRRSAILVAFVLTTYWHLFVAHDDDDDNNESNIFSCVFFGSSSLDPATAWAYPVRAALRIPVDCIAWPLLELVMWAFTQAALWTSVLVAVGPRRVAEELVGYVCRVMLLVARFAPWLRLHHVAAAMLRHHGLDDARARSAVGTSTAGSPSLATGGSPGIVKAASPRSQKSAAAATATDRWDLDYWFRQIGRVTHAARARAGLSATPRRAIGGQRPDREDEDMSGSGGADETPTRQHQSDADATPEDDNATFGVDPGHGDAQELGERYRRAEQNAARVGWARLSGALRVIASLGRLRRDRAAVEAAQLDATRTIAELEAAAGITQDDRLIAPASLSWSEHHEWVARLPRDVRRRWPWAAALEAEHGRLVAARRVLARANALAARTATERAVAESAAAAATESCDDGVTRAAAAQQLLASAADDVTERVWVALRFGGIFAHTLALLSPAPAAAGLAASPAAAARYAVQPFIAGAVGRSVAAINRAGIRVEHWLISVVAAEFAGRRSFTRTQGPATIAAAGVAGSTLATAGGPPAAPAQQAAPRGTSSSSVVAAVKPTSALRHFANDESSTIAAVVRVWLWLTVLSYLIDLPTLCALAGFVLAVAIFTREPFLVYIAPWWESSPFAAELRINLARCLVPELTRGAATGTRPPSRLIAQVWRDVVREPLLHGVVFVIRVCVGCAITLWQLLQQFDSASATVAPPLDVSPLRHEREPSCTTPLGLSWMEHNAQHQRGTPPPGQQEPADAAVGLPATMPTSLDASAFDTLQLSLSRTDGVRLHFANPMLERRFTPVVRVASRPGRIGDGGHFSSSPSAHHALAGLAVATQPGAVVTHRVTKAQSIHWPSIWDHPDVRGNTNGALDATRALQLPILAAPSAAASSASAGQVGAGSATPSAYVTLRFTMHATADPASPALLEALVDLPVGLLPAHEWWELQTPWTVVVAPAAPTPAPLQPRSAMGDHSDHNCLDPLSARARRSPSRRGHSSGHERADTTTLGNGSFGAAPSVTGASAASKFSLAKWLLADVDRADEAAAARTGFDAAGRHSKEVGVPAKGTAHNHASDVEHLLSLVRSADPYAASHPHATDPSREVQPAAAHKDGNAAAADGGVRFERTGILCFAVRRRDADASTGVTPVTIATPSFATTKGAHSAAAELPTEISGVASRDSAGRRPQQSAERPSTPLQLRADAAAVQQVVHQQPETHTQPQPQSIRAAAAVVQPLQLAVLADRRSASVASVGTGVPRVPPPPPGALTVLTAERPPTPATPRQLPTPRHPRGPTTPLMAVRPAWDVASAYDASLAANSQSRRRGYGTPLAGGPPPVPITRPENDRGASEAPGTPRPPPPQVRTPMRTPR